MDIRKTYGTNKEAALEGKWFDLTESSRIKVAKLGNANFKAEVMRLQKPYQHILRSTKLDHTELLDDITTKAMAKTILLDWEGLTQDGKELHYSPELAYELLKEHPDFREDVSNLSVDRNNFSLEEVAGK